VIDGLKKRGTSLLRRRQTREMRFRPSERAKGLVATKSPL